MNIKITTEKKKEETYCIPAFQFITQLREITVAFIHLANEKCQNK